MKHILVVITHVSGNLGGECQSHKNTYGDNGSMQINK